MYNANGAKIIPFPGVSLNRDDDFLNGLDGFLKEMGYRDDKEAPKVRGFRQSGRPQNEVESFLHEMGYID